MTRSKLIELLKLSLYLTASSTATKKFCSIGPWPPTSAANPFLSIARGRQRTPPQSRTTSPCRACSEPILNQFRT